MSGKKYSFVIVHLAAWLLFFSLPILFLQGRREVDELLVISLPEYWLFCASFLGLYYLNNLILIPKLYLAKKYAVFFTSILLLCALFTLVKPFDQLIRTYRGFRNAQTEQVVSVNSSSNAVKAKPSNSRAIFFDIVSFFLFLLLVALSLAIQIGRQWRLSEQQVIRAEADKNQAELLALKAQINPHFLFNTLNSIYTLTLTNNPAAAESIMKLSRIMRYITDDAAQETVALKDDVNCISDYISLQRLRLGDKIPISYKVSGDLKSIRVVPLIMMTFIENIFKNGISKHEAAPVSIEVKASGDSVSLFCQNRIFENHTRVERSGIGMTNTRKRLQHAYPNRHTLDINTEGGLYTVNLSLKT